MAQALRAPANLAEATDSMNHTLLARQVERVQNLLRPGMAVLAARILDEEKALRIELPGYSAYVQKVHYRLVPYVW